MSKKPFSLPSTPQSLGGLSEYYLRLYGHCVFKVLPAAFCMVLISTIPEVVIKFVTLGQWQLTILLVLIMLIVFLFQGVLLLQINGFIQGKLPSFKNTVQALQGRLFSLWSLMLITYLVLSIGFALMIVPGIIIAIYFIFNWLILLLEQKTVKQSLMGSIKLVHGCWWRILAACCIFILINIVIILVAMILGFIAGLIINIPMYILHVLNIGNPIISITITNALLMLVIGTMLAPLPICFLLMLYHDVCCRKRQHTLDNDDDNASIIA